MATKNNCLDFWCARDNATNFGGRLSLMTKVFLDTMKQKKVKVLAEDVTTHVVYVRPLNTAFDDSSQPLYHSLEHLKFDLASIS